jgi:citronellyl-CoA dehydrogenase
MGFTYQMLQFQEERLWGAPALRSLDRMIDQTIDYTRERQAFGKSILDNQVVHFRLAELRTEVEALRALTYRAVELLYVAART